MRDFETLLAERLNDLVDHEAGSPQAAPAFVPTDDPHREHRPARTRWVLAAAVIALVAGLTWAGVTRVIITQGPSVAGPPTPSGTASAFSPSPSVLSSTAVDSPGPAATRPTTTVVGDMTLVLPAGWVVSEMVYPKGTSGIPGATEWCIDPVGAKDTCTIRLTAARDAAGNPLDVDIEGGWSSNPSYCFDERATNPTTVRLDVADVRSFGGREAEHRVWTHSCSASKVIHVEQYEVAYAPAWILFSEVADSTVSAAMSAIAQSSTLPAQMLPLRLADRGYVRSIRSTDTGYVIALDRIYLDPSQPSGEINNASTTYAYTVPKAVLTQVPVVGDRVGIVTNGSTVTGFSFYGG